MNTVERRIGQPAVYTFDCFFDEKRCVECGWPENIGEWGWHSMLEVKDTIQLGWKYAHKKSDPNYTRATAIAPLVFEPRNYVNLNRKVGDRGETSLTWFIHYSEGVLFLKRPPSACPFEDPDLYVPVRWSKRVMSAAGRFVKKIQADVDNGKLTATMFNGSEECATHFIES